MQGRMDIFKYDEVIIGKEYMDRDGCHKLIKSVLIQLTVEICDEYITQVDLTLRV